MNTWAEEPAKIRPVLLRRKRKSLMMKAMAKEPETPASHETPRTAAYSTPYCCTVMSDESLARMVRQCANMEVRWYVVTALGPRCSVLQLMAPEDMPPCRQWTPRTQSKIHAYNRYNRQSLPAWMQPSRRRCSALSTKRIRMRS